MTASGFTFEISLTVLNHLGRQLYRNFITILGEAISNAWDADATNVWIDVDTDAAEMRIVDDGAGMDSYAFQEKFLKIGYSKRQEAGGYISPGGRHFVGAKGIGKLALLSCAQRVSIATKTAGTSVVGGLIDNGVLDEAIVSDMTPDRFALTPPDARAIDALDGLARGTSLLFDQVKIGKNSETFLRKAIAHYFRFSLYDQGFTIHLNGHPVTVADLADLAAVTQYLWLSDGFADPYLTEVVPDAPPRRLPLGDLDATGFIASVDKPSQLAIYGTGEHIGIDLFVNGRVRERNILTHLPSDRVAARYLYGQIHLDSLDDDLHDDPFTSSREGVAEGNPIFNALIDALGPAIRTITNEWDKLRTGRGQPGDDENTRLTPGQRAAAKLAATAAEKLAPTGTGHERGKRELPKPLREAEEGARVNVEQYVMCYLIENLLRDVVVERQIPLPSSAVKEAEQKRHQEDRLQRKTGELAQIRQDRSDVYYLDYRHLAGIVDGEFAKDFAGLGDDVDRLAPLRNAVMHTAPLARQACTSLEAVTHKIRAKVQRLLTLLDDQQ